LKIINYYPFLKNNYFPSKKKTQTFTAATSPASAAPIEQLVGDQGGAGRHEARRQRLLRAATRAPHRGSDARRRLPIFQYIFTIMAHLKFKFIYLFLFIYLLFFITFYFIIFLQLWCI
jgi:hypothetical protein